MVDLSKHLARTKQATDRRNYDLALEIAGECQEIDPANIDNYKLLLDAAKRRAKEGGKKGMGLRLSFGKDPHKLLSGAIKAVGKDPSIKNLLSAGDAAMKAHQGGSRGLIDVAILLYEEGKATGMYNKDLLWNLAQAYYAAFGGDKNKGEELDKAIAVMVELCRNDPEHGEAARALKNWEAKRSMVTRVKAGGADDYRTQIADTGTANKAEVLGRVIRTVEDAREVLAYVEGDLKERPDDKDLWVKKGDVHKRINEFDEAAAAYHKAAEVDPHDFVVVMRLGDIAIAKQTAEVKRLQAAGQDVKAAHAQLVELEIAEFRKRAERQPTEMSHRFNLGVRLFNCGDIDGAAGELQHAVKDPRFRRKGHSYLGHCFAKKGLLDLAQKQFTDCLSLIEDDVSDEYKEVLYNRARVCEASGATDQAIEDLTRVVEMDLGYKDAANRLSQLRS
ncbi:MAG: tetratricopeptide repeat protein [Planctomycetota bacterium]|jgi:tetratricopeptide (TPR) repeat protein